MTNRQWVESLTDEEFAEWLSKVNGWFPTKRQFQDFDIGRKEWLLWLQEEHKNPLDLRSNSEMGDAYIEAAKNMRKIGKSNKK